jgi:hypothetical protein
MNNVFNVRKEVKIGLRLNMGYLSVQDVQKYINKYLNRYKLKVQI